MKTATCFMAAVTFAAIIGVTVEAAGPSTKVIAKPSRAAAGAGVPRTTYRGESIPLIGPDNANHRPISERLAPRTSRNTRTQYSETATHRPPARRSPIQRTSAVMPERVYQDVGRAPTGPVETVSYSGCTSCGDVACDGGCGEGYLGCDSCYGDPCCSSCQPFFKVVAGIDLTFLKPHYEASNLAFVQERGNDISFQTFSDTEFDYDTDVAPRVWLSLSGGEQLGLRLEYWQFDHSAPSRSGQPAANGFGSISSPEIETFRLFSRTPESVLTAQSALDAYVIDIAATQKAFVGCWGLETLAGIRIAQIEQGYDGTLIDDEEGLRESLRFHQKMQGVGPSFGVQFRRPFGCNLSLFGKARGSLLFGDGTSNLSNVQDQDLDDDFTITHDTVRDDVFSISELQVGIGWSPVCWGRVIPSAHIAYEGQLWSDVGSPSDVRGDLGFYGFNIGFGLDW